MLTNEGLIPVTGGRVWYKMIGNSPNTPLLVLHGGPGSSHFAMEPLCGLAEHRTVIFYDQLGSGQSSRPNDKNLWQTHRFVEELALVRQALHLDCVHLLGHSWGTMLLAEYLLQGAAGVASAIFSSPCLSAKRWIADANRLRMLLPDDVQATLRRCEQTGETDSAEYRAASDVYMKRHGCRVPHTKEYLERREKDFNPEVYQTMWGPSEFCATGSLKNFDCTSQLSTLGLPVLFTCGRYDEATPESTSYYQSLVPQAQLHIFENSAHSAYFEETPEYLKVIGEFLSIVDSNRRAHLNVVI